MKLISAVGTATATLFIATMMPVYAQHEGRGDKPAGKEEQQQHAQQPRPQAQPQQHAQQPKPQAQPQQHAQQPKPQARPQQHAQQPKPPAHLQQHAQQPKPPAQPQQHAQQPRPQAQPQQHAQQSKPQPRQQQHAQTPKPQQVRQQPQRTQQQAQTWQHQKGWQQHGSWPAHATWQQTRSGNWSSDHRSWAQRGGYGGYYIPQDRFNLYFGGGHFFRLGALPVMYLGYPRFEYGGFAFLLVDPWPEGWSENWYASDDVYIDYDGGYYLYNRRYPQNRLAITIVL